MMLAALARAATTFIGPTVVPEVAGQPSVVDVTGRTETPAYKPGVSTKVILVYGQSNAISIVNDTSFTPSAGTENFDYFNGKNYSAKDPLLGTPLGGGLSSGSSWVTRLGSKMVDAGMASRVVVVDCAVGGTYIADWNAGGILDGRLQFVVRAMAQAGLKPDYIMQMQGESDALAGTTATAYTTSCRSVIAGLRRNGTSAPVFVSNTSMFSGVTGPNAAAVRLGQTNSWNDALGIFAGPDTDLIVSPNRGADGHLTLSGLGPCADLWLSTLQAYSH